MWTLRWTQSTRCLFWPGFLPRLCLGVCCVLTAAKDETIGCIFSDRAQPLNHTALLRSAECESIRGSRAAQVSQSHAETQVQNTGCSHLSLGGFILFYSRQRGGCITWEQSMRTSTWTAAGATWPHCYYTLTAGLLDWRHNGVWAALLYIWKSQMCFYPSVRTHSLPHTYADRCTYVFFFFLPLRC